MTSKNMLELHIFTQHNNLIITNTRILYFTFHLVCCVTVTVFFYFFICIINRRIQGGGAEFEGKQGGGTADCRERRGGHGNLPRRGDNPQEYLCG